MKKYLQSRKYSVNRYKNKKQPKNLTGLKETTTQEAIKRGGFPPSG